VCILLEVQLYQKLVGRTEKLSTDFSTGKGGNTHESIASSATGRADFPFSIFQIPFFISETAEMNL